jgi:hypothetical protein
MAVYYSGNYTGNMQDIQGFFGISE